MQKDFSLMEEAWVGLQTYEVSGAVREDWGLYPGVAI
jgi:hypothetical protein